MSNKEYIREAMKNMENNSIYLKDENKEYKVIVFKEWVENITNKAFLIKINGGEYMIWVSKKYIKYNSVSDNYILVLNSSKYTIFRMINKYKSLYGEKQERTVSREYLISMFNGILEIRLGEEAIEITKDDLDYFLNY